MFYRQAGSIYPNKNRTKISRYKHFFIGFNFLFRQPLKYGTTSEKILPSVEIGKEVGFKSLFQVKYVPVTVATGRKSD